MGKIGASTRNVSVNMPVSLRKDLERLASDAGMSLSAYIKAILSDAAKNEVSVSIRIEKRGK